MGKLENLLRYNIDSNLANKIITKRLNISSLRSLSKDNLKDDYDFSVVEIDIIKEKLNRQPIDEEILIQLLEKSSYTCNICKGVKSDAYIVHHITPYNITQDNSYENLIVLCPNDHELAHREGEALANKITKKQLISAKNKWEQYVSEIPARKAAAKGDIETIDYINVNRILELTLRIFKSNIPQTNSSQQLYKNNYILETGEINPALYERYSINPNTPLKFFAGYGSGALIQHYFELLLECLKNNDLCDLDDLLNSKSLNEGVIGKFCYYIGGVYGRQYKGEINANSKPTLLHFRRKKIRVKWFIDPMYITSVTATWRISSRTIFLIYGRILSVNIVEEGKDRLLEIIIQPYAYGTPNFQKNRTPMIKYIKESENYDDFFDGE